MDDPNLVSNYSRDPRPLRGFGFLFVTEVHGFNEERVPPCGSSTTERWDVRDRTILFEMLNLVLFRLTRGRGSVNIGYVVSNGS